MTNLILYFQRQFSHGLILFRQVKDRVIAKPLLTLGLEGYEPATLAITELYFTIR